MLGQPTFLQKTSNNQVNDAPSPAIMLEPVYIPLNASYNIEITGYSRAQPEAFKSACLKYWSSIKQ